MNSGPLAGLAEIALPALQPGSSIMPGKVNPVVPESVTMMAAQVIGNDATITVAGQSGNFQLNVMLPLIAYNLLQSLELLASAAAIWPIMRSPVSRVNRARMRRRAGAQSHPGDGAQSASSATRRARPSPSEPIAEGRPILDVAAEMTDLSVDELRRLLDPKSLTEGGIKGAGS